MNARLAATAKTEDFLKRHSLTPDAVDMDSLLDLFRCHKDRGLAGDIVDVEMIPSYIAPPASIRRNCPVIVLDAGGTNLRSSLVSFDSEGKPVVEGFKRVRMPGSRGPVSSREFFSVLADQVERLIDKSDLIGFCFSYAVQIGPNHDGVALDLSKEIQASEVVGKSLGENLLAELAGRGHDVSAKKVAILNDTVTTLLAASSHPEIERFGSSIGFILGTGLNTAYLERNANIPKIGKGFDPNGLQVINEESGAMDICPGDIDRLFFKTTKNPEAHHLEKLVSGAYLGPLAFMATYCAYREGILSAAVGKILDSFGTFETAEISMFLAQQPCRLSESMADLREDSHNLRLILSSIIERAGKLVAADLASAVMACASKDGRPVLINADGTTFYKTFGLKKAVVKHLDAVLGPKGFSYEFACIENSPTIGSAIGALAV